MARIIVPLLGVFAAALLASAEENIGRFLVDIEVERDGDIVVTETITVNAEGRQIRRGIFRDLPAYYLDEETGGKLDYRYDVMSVRRNGRREPYESYIEGNARQIRIGDADRFLPHGEHTYEIKYGIKNQVRYNEEANELYWNVTGTYWAFPIHDVEARIFFPGAAEVRDRRAYTGYRGQSGEDYRYTREGGTHVFRTTRPFAAGEGLTVSLSVDKGIIDPPSRADKSWLWWARYGSLIVLIGSLMGLGGFYYRSFAKVGRDPAKPPVFPRYDPPEGYSPAAAHHIFYRGLRGHGALIASLMQLAVSGYAKISEEGKDTLVRLEKTGGAQKPLPDDTSRLREDMFGGQALLRFDGKPDTGFVRDYERFKAQLKSSYGERYFKWNHAYMVIGGIASVLALIIAINLVSFWTLWHTLAIGGLVLLNGLFMYLMPAPTRKGQDIRTHIEGFRLYMEKAEALQLNAVEVGSEAPPPMTKDRYEAFLPYAVALGVEKPWTKHFERLVPEIAKSYSPGWAHMAGRGIGPRGINKAVTGALSSGVSSSMPQSSGSSGSGGGGFSGGGGGGGGGGGW